MDQGPMGVVDPKGDYCKQGVGYAIWGNSMDGVELLFILNQVFRKPPIILNIRWIS